MLLKAVSEKILIKLMWIINEKGEKEFTGGSEDYKGAQKEASSCIHFKPDVEDEIVDDVLCSCYNCIYRRWTPKSITCCKK